MADGVAITAGSGTTILTDDTGASGHAQVVKLAYSADGVATLVTVDADGVLVNLGANNDVTVTGSVTANAGTNLNTSALALESGGNLDTIAGDTTAIQAAVELIDDTVKTLGTDTYTEATTKGLVIGAVRRDADTTLVDTTNEVAPLQVDANGRLKVEAFSGETLPVSGTVTANLAAGTNNIGDVDILSIAAGDNNIGNVDIVTMPNVTLAAGTNTNEVVGDVAHSAGVAGNPVLVAGVAQNGDDTAPPNRVDAESDATRFATDWDGSVYVRPHGPQVWSYHLNTSTAQTDATVHAAPGAGLSLYVGTIVFSSGAATAINMFLEEGASTVIGPFYLEATAGRGMAVQFNPPRKITANTALTITTSASIAHSVDITGFTAQG